jgi:alpha-glucoside transport system permease protein
MDNIAGKKSSLSWAVNISVVLMVVLWLIPTIGLLVSSFRDRDQISESGWWEAPFPVELTFRARAFGRGRGEENGTWVLEGNVFDDPEQARWFPDGSGVGYRLRHARRRARRSSPPVRKIELRDGTTVVIRGRLLPHDAPDEFGAARPPSISRHEPRRSSPPRTTTPC